MAANKRWRLVCYDIREARRLREVHKIVSGHGERVQYSVYRARLDDRQVEAMRWQLSRIMQPEDSLLIVDLCPTCASNVISRNHVEGWEVAPATFRIIGGSTDQASVGDDDDQVRDLPEARDGEEESPA